MKDLFGAEFRRVEDREHEGQPAVAVVAERTYDTTPDDLWDAITNPERLPRWFTAVEGDLREGGRYQLKGNAGGTITRCEKPRTLHLTWEMHGGVSWVQLRLAPHGARTKLTLEHIAPRGGPGEAHFEKYGPGAVGVGWDLSLHGLGLHVHGGAAPAEPAAVAAWMASEGPGFVRASGEAWGEAHAASGADREAALASAQRTIAFYTGG